MLAEASIEMRLLCGMLLSAPVIGYGLYLLRQTQAMRGWESTTAKITSFRKEWESSQHGLTQKAFVTYSYGLHGKTYQGSRITVSDWLLASGMPKVNRLAKCYTVGAVTTAYYDPLQPERSVLRKPSYVLPLAIIVIGLICLAVIPLLTLRSERVVHGSHSSF